jgi:hypothetical protein
LSLISPRKHRPVTCRDRHRLEVFRNAVLRWIFGLKREEVNRELEKIT